MIAAATAVHRIARLRGNSAAIGLFFIEEAGTDGGKEASLISP